MLRGDGVDIAARDYHGEGVPLLLMHGGGGNLAQLSVLARALSHFRVIAIDARNHGRSGDGEWTWRAVGADISAVLQQLGIERAVVAGYSYGGMSAVMFGEAHPESTLAVVNIDGHGLGDPEHYVGYEPDAVEVGIAKARDALVEQGTGMLPPADIEMITAGLREQLVALGLEAADAADATERSLRRDCDGTASMRQSPEQMTALLDAVIGLDLLSAYRTITVPTLIFNATQGELPKPDQLTDIANLMAAYRPGLTKQLELVAAESSNVRVVDVDATHGLVFEQPTSIADEIRRFVNEATEATEAR